MCIHFITYCIRVSILYHFIFILLSTYIFSDVSRDGCCMMPFHKGLHIESRFFCFLQMDEDDFKEEQNSVARLIQMLYNNDPEEMLKVFLHFGNFV